MLLGLAQALGVLLLAAAVGLLLLAALHLPLQQQQDEHCPLRVGVGHAAS